jgi:7,8-dihydro-6-hydroxymethylpterin dimethyltransferase
MSEMKKQSMLSVNNCGVCARLLVYATNSVTKICALCGKEEKTSIYCPAGHYVCDACHCKAALEVLKQILNSSKTTDPAAILEQVMSHPAVPMHGPEHHVIVPAAIVAAVRNSKHPLPENAIETVLERASNVPGGWCGLYGDCGAAVGAGIAVSVLTEATPLTGKQRTLAMASTSQALSRMLDEQPRCCKRASRIAIQSAVDFLRDHLGINLPQAEKVRCSYPLRNLQCAREKCSNYDPSFI